MPVSSLPSAYGIGCFSKEAYDFVLWLKEAGQTWWQILPLGPTGYGDSPYQSFSVFAGNPYFVDLEELINEGVLTREECDAAHLEGDGGKIDYQKQYISRISLLRNAFDRSNMSGDSGYCDFLNCNADWLDDFALFMACKVYYGGKEFSTWDNDIRNRQISAVLKYTRELSEEIEFHKYIQYKFFSQWQRLKEFANNNGVKIIGDIPIYTAMDSCDVWTNRRLFNIAADGTPINVAGCPPDGFSADGQLWGNPTYNWSVHKQTGYNWWIKRLTHCFKMYDVVRIDHFRGFDEFYSIPYGEKTARKGKWEKGPRKELFEAFESQCGKCDIIAEDLGFVTDTVREMVSDLGYPGMKILQFAFDSRDSGSVNDYLPHNYPVNCAAYTGTHDNSTLQGWLMSLPEKEMTLLRAYLCDFLTPREDLNLPVISLVMRSNAKYCIIPMQDWLNLDDSARMNKPSTLGGNWTWRIKNSDLSSELCKLIRTTTERYGRI